MHKAKLLPFFASGESIRTGTNSTADLKRLFLELQRLRQRVRIAECGRIARTRDGSNHEIQFSKAEPSKHPLRARD